MAWSETGAVVEISKSSSTSLAASYDIPQGYMTDGKFVPTSYLHARVFATTVTTVKETRGLTKTAALEMVGSSASKENFRSRNGPGGAWCVVPNLVGEETTRTAHRANEADGWTVTETTAETTATDAWS